MTSKKSDGKESPEVFFENGMLGVLGFKFLFLTNDFSSDEFSGIKI